MCNIDLFQIKLLNIFYLTSKFKWVIQSHKIVKEELSSLHFFLSLSLLSSPLSTFAKIGLILLKIKKGNKEVRNIRKKGKHKMEGRKMILRHEGRKRKNKKWRKAVRSSSTEI